jgi:hypothetical protein
MYPRVDPAMRVLPIATARWDAVEQRFLVRPCRCWARLHRFGRPVRRGCRRHRERSAHGDFQRRRTVDTRSGQRGRDGRMLARRRHRCRLQLRPASLAGDRDDRPEPRPPRSRRRLCLTSLITTTHADQQVCDRALDNRRSCPRHPLPRRPDLLRRPPRPVRRSGDPSRTRQGHRRGPRLPRPGHPDPRRLTATPHARIPDTRLHYGMSTADLLTPGHSLDR